MQNCDHKVFNLKPRLVEGSGVTTEIIILACETCNSIIDYFDPAIFNGEALKLAQIKKQYNVPPEYYQDHVLRKQIEALEQDVERYKHELEKSNKHIEELRNNEKNKIKNQYNN